MNAEEQGWADLERRARREVLVLAVAVLALLLTGIWTFYVG